ncbi:FAD-dependent oxidoreductase [Nitriliruptor alkaliphilus]|uniref:FAD-dependent oxidoreductase n=1 Tax=Nitriliruptor alkaliphilus TaxID=427918 RepID=UPI000695AD60|nr:FAD-dependent oxidoreductase [Nitriliruptor alkaliphilus]
MNHTAPPIDLGTSDAPYAPLGPASPPLAGDRRAEVVVVGGGLVGATTALLLAERGHEVVLLEAHRIGGGTSGRSTGKVTSQHGAIYGELVRRHGRGVAEHYARSNQAAIGTIERTVARYGIDCQLESVATYLHALTSSGARELRHEAAVARTLGLPATLTADAPVPDAVRAGLRFDDQRQFDPRAYTIGVARAAASQGATLHEVTPVRRVRPRRGRVRVHTDTGTLEAQHVVLAMLTPWPDVIGAFARTSPNRAACIAVEVATDVPHDPSLGIDGPLRSSRRWVPATPTAGGTGTERLILLASGWRPGTRDETAVFHELADEAVHRWGARRVTHHWAAMDQMSADRLPLIGGLPRLHAASGFSKWGMTGGTIAAELLADRVAGRAPDSPFAATRLPDLRAVGKMAAASTRDGYELLRRRVPPPGGRGPVDLGPGEGRVVATLTGPVAVSADEQGRRRAVSATCTHLGCTVRWNAAAAAWSCACHGSRFSPDGQILGGPATTPLPPREDPAEPAS